MIEQLCPQCGRPLELPDEAAGKRGRCPECQHVFIVDVGNFVADAGEASAGNAADSDGEQDWDSSTNPFERPLDPGGPTPWAEDPGTGVNPYAPSAFDHSGFNKRPELEIRKISIDQAFASAWAVFQNRIGTFLVLGLIWLLFQAGTGILQSAAQEYAQANGGANATLVSNAMQIMSTLLNLYLTLGVYAVTLAVIRNQPTPLGRLFVNPVTALKYALGWLIVIAPFAIVGGIILGILFAVDREFFTVGVIGATVVGVLLLILSNWPLWCWAIVLADRDNGTLESMKYSISAMTSNPGTTFLLLVINFVTMAIGFLACCIGVIAAFPFTQCLGVVAYLLISGQLAPLDASSPSAFGNAAPVSGVGAVPPAASPQMGPLAQTGNRADAGNPSDAGNRADAGDDSV
ncbi:MAG: hypothetical protein AAF958_19190 [Planctomycetota bacterium]